MIINDCVFEQERAFADPGAGPLADVSRYRRTVTDTAITYNPLPSGLWVPTFNGATSEIVIGQGPEYDLLTGMTILAWGISTVASNTLVGKYSTGGANRAYALRDTTFSCQDNAGAYSAGDEAGFTSPGSDGVWHLFCGIWQLNTRPQAWFDGLYEAQSADVVVDVGAVAYDLKIGTSDYSGSEVWDGQIALVKIFNYVLSAGQVRNYVQETASLVGRYDLC